MKIKSNMLALGIGGANVILCALYFSFKAAPWFALGILLTITSIVVFMQTENWLTHDATEFENRFWTMVAMIVSFVLFFAVDSPLSFVSRSPSLAWLLVGIVTFLAHNYHRHLTRIVLSRVPNMKRVTSADFSILEHRVKAKEMLAEIRSLILSIDRPFISSTFLNLFSLARVLYAERRIISIFEEAGPEQLNFLVLNVQLGLLLYKIKDHRYARQFHRTKLLTLLAVNRVTELSSASRAMLLDGFQRMKLSAHPQAEQWAQSIILKTKGDNLSELKSLTDCKGDFNSMHKLIYWDVRNAAVKSEILKHIETQAKVQASHMILRTKAARLRDKFAWRKILSDVDDTLSCSGGAFPAGCDVSFPKKCIYPGVLAFYRELDLGTTGPDHWESDKRIGNLVFLSARPHLYKDLLESHSYEKFRRLQDTAGMHTSPSLLPGEMVSGTEFFVSGSMEPIARKKYDNFREYLSLYVYTHTRCLLYLYGANVLILMLCIPQISRVRVCVHRRQRPGRRARLGDADDSGGRQVRLQPQAVLHPRGSAAAPDLHRHQQHPVPRQCQYILLHDLYRGRAGRVQARPHPAARPAGGRGGRQGGFPTDI